MKKIKSDLIKSYIGYVIIGIILIVVVFHTANENDISFFIPTYWGEPEIVSAFKSLIHKRFFIPTVTVTLILVIALVYSTLKVRKVLKEISKFEVETEKSLDDLEINNYQYKYQELSRINDVMNETILKIKQNQILEKQLTNSIMHDIKTPLHIMNAYNDMLIVEGESKEYTEKIKKKIKDLNNIIESSLDRKERNYIILNDSLKEVLSSYIENYKMCNFHISINDNDNSKIHINEIDFKRIIINVIDNAIKALDGHKNIYITAKCNTLEIENEGFKIDNKDFLDYVNDVSNLKQKLGTKIIYKLCLENEIDIEYVKTDIGTKVVLKFV